AFSSLQKITTTGFDGSEGRGFSLTNHTTNAAGDALKETAHADPTALVGFDSLGIGDIQKIVRDREVYIQSLKDSGDIADYRKARTLESQETLG
ncbi:hypothetical protein, partial [Streptomyces sp. P17]|uniref:hypothetical protein n=1 Tax=Streptomyces sp. P17 TaxID=3074716 RepID=UPI0028F41A89